MVACGGSTSSSSSNDGNGTTAPPDAGSGGDSGGSVVPPSSGSDAGVAPSDAGAIDSSVDPPGSDVYPADHPPLPLMTNFGGSVITDMKMITVTFVGNTSRDAIRKFDDAIVADDWWTSVTRGYGINKGTGGVYVETADTVSNTTIDNDKDIKPWIQKLVDAGTLPPPDANTLYALYYPSSTTITLADGAGAGGTATSCQAFGAYHDSAAVTVSGKTVDAAFAVIPDCGGGYEESASHEFIEAATDPHPISTINKPTWYMYDDAWSPSGPGGGEVADQCETRGPSTTTDGFSAAKSWVNAAAKESKDPCQPSDPGKIFFGLAVQTEKQTIKDPTDPAGGTYESYGYITLKAGETKTLDTVVFSEAKLPHDLTLVVGKRGQSTDPTKVSAIATGITSTLSATTGTNGQHRTLTLTAAPGTAAGDHPFVLRAILEQNDYHSWFVILRVQ